VETTARRGLLKEKMIDEENCTKMRKLCTLFQYVGSGRIFKYAWAMQWRSHNAISKLSRFVDQTNLHAAQPIIEPNGEWKAHKVIPE
jgi:hypothetical protein